MNKHELQQKISSAIQEQRSILDKAKSEKRNYTTEEKNRHDELQTNIENYKRELNIIQQEEDQLRTELDGKSNEQDKRDQSKKRFSKS